VAFGISCKPAVQANFDRGVSFLHSFWYDSATDSFAKVIASDPDCAMGYWGQAMTGFPQINGWPDDAAVAAAERALASADAARERTPRAHVTAAGYRSDRVAADQAVRALDALVQQDAPPPVGSLKRTVPEEIRAWAALTRGDLALALTLLRPVAERQDKVGKGEVELPAREMLADMLLLRGDANQALTGSRHGVWGTPGTMVR